MPVFIHVARLVLSVTVRDFADSPRAVVANASPDTTMSSATAVAALRAVDDLPAAMTAS
jgi:hypothetical protein